MYLIEPPTGTTAYMVEAENIVEACEELGFVAIQCKVMKFSLQSVHPPKTALVLEKINMMKGKG